MDNKLTYELAYSELQQLTRAIETEAVSVDVLAEKVQRASFLISFCQERLRATETEVNKIIGQMGSK
ncbi:MAG: exodeoxyribonuclease VII small subunit [Chitinophagaceae bacterium]|nr:MAG: exodeoxyribonuclease VII small subunit [Chitinophagaceae bacterium]